jgi:hypothetical protein
MLRLIALLMFALPAYAQQDCSKVPEPYKAQCEAALGKKADVDKACAGKTGDDYKSCVGQNNRQATGGSPGAAAREACRPKYKVNDTSEFEKCMREEMAKRGR